MENAVTKAEADGDAIRVCSKAGELRARLALFAYNASADRASNVVVRPWQQSPPQ
jgi:hypothetical protein